MQPQDRRDDGITARPDSATRTVDGVPADTPPDDPRGQWLYTAFAAAYGLLFVCSQLMLAAGGGRVTVYALVVTLASLSAFFDSRRFRAWFLIGVLAPLVLLVDDHHRGLALQAAIQRVKDAAMQKRIDELEKQLREGR